MENDDYSIGIIQLLQILWKSKILIFFVFFLSIVLASIYLRNTPPSFTVQLQVVPVENSGGSEINNVLGQYSDIAGMVGISIPNVSTGNFEHFKRIIKSRAVYLSLMEKNDLMKIVFGSAWDENLNNSWVPEELSFQDKIKNAIKWMLGMRIYPQKPPNIDDFERLINSMISISTDREGIVTTISAQAQDPKFGKIIIENLHHEADMI